MATGPIYQKYGVKPIAMSEMQSSQRNTADAFSGVFDDIESLLGQAEKNYRQENTLNLQEHLKGQLKQQGLGADPVDIVAIKQKFGNLVDMDQIDSTITDTTKEMETEAINLAGAAGNDALAQTKDPIQARQRFVGVLSEMGASEAFKGAATKAWSDMKATEFTDTQAEKLQNQNKNLDSIIANVAESGPDAAYSQIEMALQNEDPKDRTALREKWRKAVDAVIDEKPEQTRRNQSYLEQYDRAEAIKLQEFDEEIGSLTSQRAALQKQYVPQTAYDKLAANTTRYGQSAVTAIDDELGWFNSSDVSNIKEMRNQMIKDGIPDPEAEAILTHVFDLVYDGGSWHGNNLSSGDITAAENEVNRLTSLYKARTSLDNDLTEATNQASRYKLESQLNRSTLQQDLTKASRDRNAMFNPQGSAAVWEKHLKKAQGGNSGESVGTGSTDTADANEDPFNPNNFLPGGNSSTMTAQPDAPADFNFTTAEEQVETVAQTDPATADNLRQKLQQYRSGDTTPGANTDDPNIVNGYDIEKYATDPKHEQKVKKIVDNMPDLTSTEDIDQYIKRIAKDSPITGEMVTEAVTKYNIDPKVLIAIMRQDSSLGTKGKGARSFNPGNVGNDDTGKIVNYGSWEKGVEAVAKWLNKHKVA